MGHRIAHVRTRWIIGAALGVLLGLPSAAAQAAPRAALTMTGTGAPPGAPAQDGHGAAVRLDALPAHPRVGQRVRLSVADPPAGATEYAWDLTGPGPYVSGPREGPLAETTFASAGIKVVGVRFTVAGVTRQGLIEVPVSPAPAPRATGHAAAPGTTASRTMGATRVPVTRALGTARLAGDPGVTIADFHFSPGTTTVHVGDTVTWANNGPSSHSATASNGGFNTGILKQGQSASHTFTQAGTFTYFCEIHPFMHGTIVVLASTTPTTSTATATSPAAAPTTTNAPSSTTPAAAPAGTAASSTTDAAASSQPTLPVTGLDVLSGLGAGLLLIGFGAVLRRAVRP
jgi:plastocyanin